jgi:diguanylate cyclase (GGDEF)-like protein
MITKTIDLRTRMVLLVILATLPITTVLIFQSITVHRDNVSRVFSEATALALRIAAYPKEILPEPGRYLGNISRLQEMSRPEECASLLKLLDPVKKVQPYFTTVTIYLPNGNRICPVPEPGENANVADRKYFQDVIRTRSYAVSNLLLGRRTKQELIIFSQPVSDERGQTKYVINLGLDINLLKSLIAEAVAKARLPDGSTVLLLDDDGIPIVAEPDTYSRIGTRIPGWESLRPLFSKSGDMAREELWEDGTRQATVYIPLFESPNGNLRIRVGIPIEPALREVAKADAIRIVSITSVVMLALGLAWFISERLVLRPIRSISSAATALKNGVFSARVGNVKATGELGELAMAFDSMANQIQEDRKSLQFLATHDPLTGLPNRYWIRERLSQLTETPPIDQRRVGLILLDLDGFKEINDSFGHQLGDKVLIQVAHILSSAMNGKGTPGRLGGDEFVMIAEGLQTHLEFEELAKAFQEQLRRPIIIGDNHFFVSASMGIAIFPEHGEDTDTLIQNADVAMYRAKTEKMPSYRFYSPSMNESSSARLRMQNLLSQAVDRNELVLYYQPKIDARSGRITGAEALIRWNSNKLGLVLPEQFIPLAEETGLIVEIGEWVLRSACVQLNNWKDALPRKFSMAVNLSPRQFLDPDLAEKMTRIIESASVSAIQLELEITENALMHNPVKAIAALTQMRSLGAKVSIDDFGTGYSSLSYLKNLPIDALKIDQSFIAGLPDDASDLAIVGAVIAIARELKLRVTAEGVETQEQSGILHALGCDEVQGYLYSRPLTAADFLAMLHQGQARADA